MDETRPQRNVFPNQSEENRRLERRARMFKGACLVFDDGFRTIPCTLRDLSDSGARLAFDGPVVIPDVFTLQVEVDGFKVACERVWQRSLLCGVRFVGEKEPMRQGRRQVIETAQSKLLKRIDKDLASREEDDAPLREEVEEDDLRHEAPPPVAPRKEHRSGFGKRKTSS